jgi:hypothetical protein
MADKEILEIRLELLRKEPVKDKDGKVVGEKCVCNTAFQVTDQDLCAEINGLLGDAITKEHIGDVRKDDDGEPIFDAHKFDIPYKPKVEKKKSA